MLILILIDVQYSQKAILEKGLNRLSHSLSGSHHVVKIFPRSTKISDSLPTSYRHLENPVYREKIEICIWFLYWCKTRKHWERKILFLAFCLLLFSFWPLAVAERVLWNRACLSFRPSFCLSGRFMEFYQ